MHEHDTHCWSKTAADSGTIMPSLRNEKRQNYFAANLYTEQNSISGTSRQS